MSDQLNRLLKIMTRLRAPDGCPWDREQDFASIAPFTIEEAYEVADAVERGDMAHLKDELGDLLFQVVFFAQMGAERNAFDFDAVAAAIADKLERRHPHVFAAGGTLSADEQSVQWENIKAAERQRASGAVEASHLEGIPTALPALMRAYKLSKRAARAGFDFEHAAQTADKVDEELAEVREAAAKNSRSEPSPEIIEEIGDLLFAAANLARKLDVDAEAALRAANGKFERRFRGMEQLARQQGVVFAELNLAAQEELWKSVKRSE
jgi:nucleoside triphosphate diphosphatase